MTTDYTRHNAFPAALPAPTESQVMMYRGTPPLLGIVPGRVYTDVLSGALAVGLPGGLLQPVAGGAVNVRQIPAGFSQLPDATAAIQKMIDALPAGAALDGGFAQFNVSALYLKSDMGLRMIRLVALGGDTDLVSPITVDGQATIPGNLTSGLKQNITLESVYVDGNRQNQRNVSGQTTRENGGRHCFRFLGRVYNVRMVGCVGTNSAGDGLEMYSGQSTTSGRNLQDDTDACFRNIVQVDCTYTGNRRHGISLDSVAVLKADRVTMNGNGLNLPSVTTATTSANRLEGARGDTVTADGGATWQLYGNGLDAEGYGVGSGLRNLTFTNCEGLGNARGGALFFDKVADHSATGFATRRGIKFIGGSFDEGVAVGREGHAISFTPPYAQRAAGYLYTGVSLIDVEIKGYLNFTATKARLSGGSIESYTGQAIGLLYADLYMSSNVEMLGTKTNVYFNTNGVLHKAANIEDIVNQANLAAPAWDNVAATSGTVNVQSGTAGTLAFVAAQVMGSTPNLISYRLTYNLTPGTSGAGLNTQLQVNPPTGYAVWNISAGAVNTSSLSTPLATSVYGGIGRFHVTAPPNAGQVAGIQIYATFVKL